MVLLWYATMATPLFGLTEADVLIDNADTERVLEKNLKKYPDSSLFTYYKGKYARTILKDSDRALAHFQKSAELIASVREIQLISIYEVGWIHLQNLDYALALPQFEQLHKESRWSKSFNSYICAVLSGCMGKFSEANALVKEALKAIAAQKRKSNPLEQMAAKRIDYMKKNGVKSKEMCKVLVVELLYLWACFPFCKQKALKKINEICDRVNDKNFIAMKCLFEGAVHIQLGDKDFGEQCLNESVARAEGVKNAPLGLYVLPCAFLELATHSVENKDFGSAKLFLSKSSGFKKYELDNRIQVRQKSLQKRIKYLTTDHKKEAARFKAQVEADAEEKRKTQKDIDDFYIK